MKTFGLFLAGLSATAAGSLPLEVPFFKQSRNGCGAASVAMVMHYWSRIPGSERTVAPAPEVYARLYDRERGGILLSHMKSYLEESGFEAFTVRGQWTDLGKHLEQGRPLIVGLRKKPNSDIHFTVLTGASDGEVTFNDPTRKAGVRVGRAEFLRQWELAGNWLLLATPRLKE